MFTGIVEELAKVSSLKVSYNIARLAIDCAEILSNTKIGDSINVNGTCLTVVKKGKASLEFDIMRETYSNTNLKFLKKGAFVNVERAISGNSRVGGHFVTGHVDRVAKVVNNKLLNKSWILEIEIPNKINQYIVEKGSIAINGVSLTIGKFKQNSFIIYLIPCTLNSTNLKNLKKNDLVNIETDILGKYVLKTSPMQTSLNSNIDIDFLKEHGFTQ